MNFVDIVKEMMNGKKARRPYFAKDEFMSMTVSDENYIDPPEMIRLYLTVDDFMATDWEVINEH